MYCQNYIKLYRIVLSVLYWIVLYCQYYVKLYCIVLSVYCNVITIASYCIVIAIVSYFILSTILDRIVFSVLYQAVSYCIVTATLYFIPCLNKYSQSEVWKAVAYFAVSTRLSRNSLESDYRNGAKTVCVRFWNGGNVVGQRRESFLHNVKIILETWMWTRNWWKTPKFVVAVLPNQGMG